MLFYTFFILAFSTPLFLIAFSDTWWFNFIIAVTLGSFYYEVGFRSRCRRKELAVANKDLDIERKNMKLKEKPLKFDVYLTALNDEIAISHSVLDFLANPHTNRVIVIDNNSSDDTRDNAIACGAEVIVEEMRGYGRVVYRCLREGLSNGTEFFFICEGDGSFAASDMEKFIPYLGHASVINGTRIQEQLRDQDTQLTSFIFFGNFLAAKLLELKHLGKGTITDLGTTFKVIHRDSLKNSLELFNPNVNLEFNAHFLDRCLRNNIRLVEVPITFRKRIGASKGGNTSNIKALRVGLRMLLGIASNWQFERRKSIVVKEKA